MGSLPPPHFFMALKSTTIAIIRSLIADTDSANYYFTNDDLNNYHDLAQAEFSLEAALTWKIASMCINVYAINEAIVKGITQILDTEVNGVEGMEGMRLLAAKYEENAVSVQAKNTGLILDVIVPGAL